MMPAATRPMPATLPKERMVIMAPRLGAVTKRNICHLANPAGAPGRPTWASSTTWTKARAGTGRRPAP
jgi:hypothetical protein